MNYLGGIHGHVCSKLSRTQLRNRRKRIAQKKAAAAEKSIEKNAGFEEEEKEKDPASKPDVWPGRLNAKWDNKKKTIVC